MKKSKEGVMNVIFAGKVLILLYQVLIYDSMPGLRCENEDPIYREAHSETEERGGKGHHRPKARLQTLTTTTWVPSILVWPAVQM